MSLTLLCSSPGIPGHVEGALRHIGHNCRHVLCAAGLQGFSFEHSHYFVEWMTVYGHDAEASNDLHSCHDVQQTERRAHGDELFMLGGYLDSAAGLLLLCNMHAECLQTQIRGGALGEAYRKCAYVERGSLVKSLALPLQRCCTHSF